MCLWLPVSASLGMLFSTVAVPHATGLHTCTWALHTEVIVVQWAAGGAGKLQAGTDSILLPALLVSLCARSCQPTSAGQATSGATSVILQL